MGHRDLGERGEPTQLYMIVCLGGSVASRAGYRQLFEAKWETKFEGVHDEVIFSITNELHYRRLYRIETLSEVFRFASRGGDSLMKPQIPKRLN